MKYALNLYQKREFNFVKICLGIAGVIALVVLIFILGGC